MQRHPTPQPTGLPPNLPHSTHMSTYPTPMSSLLTQTPLAKMKVLFAPQIRSFSNTLKCRHSPHFPSTPAALK